MTTTPTRTPRRPVKARWGDLDPELVRPGVRRVGFGTDDATLVLNELQADVDLRPHVHDFDQIALVLEGRVEFVLDDERFEVGAGEVLLIPAGVVHGGRPLDGRPALNLDVFAPARADYAHLLAWMPDRTGPRT